MKTVIFIYIALVVLAVSSCQNSSQKEATVPTMGTDCVNNPNACQTNLYQQNQGFYNYNQNYYSNNLSSLCRCPYGTVPTYNNYAGLGCVQSNQLYGYGYAYFTWGTGTTSWTNTPQISNIGSGYADACYNGVVQSCVLGQTNTCSPGYTCRPSAASSRLGLCVSNNSNTNNGNYTR